MRLRTISDGFACLVELSAILTALDPLQAGARFEAGCGCCGGTSTAWQETRTCETQVHPAMLRAFVVQRPDELLTAHWPRRSGVLNDAGGRGESASLGS